MRAVWHFKPLDDHSASSLSRPSPRHRSLPTLFVLCFLPHPLSQEARAREAAAIAAGDAAEAAASGRLLTPMSSSGSSSSLLLVGGGGGDRGSGRFGQVPARSPHVPGTGYGDDGSRMQGGDRSISCTPEGAARSLALAASELAARVLDDSHMGLQDRRRPEAAGQQHFSDVDSDINDHDHDVDNHHMMSSPEAGSGGAQDSAGGGVRYGDVGGGYRYRDWEGNDASHAGPGSDADGRGLAAMRLRRQLSRQTQGSDRSWSSYGGMMQHTHSCSATSLAGSSRSGVSGGQQGSSGGYNGGGGYTPGTIPNDEM